MSWLDEQRIIDSHVQAEAATVEERPASDWVSDRLYDDIIYPQLIPEEELEEERPKKWGPYADIIMKRYTDAYGQILELPVRKFTDTSRILKTGNHLFIIGTTGCGKSVLQYGMLFMLHNAGFGIINRDDGGLESLLLAPQIENYHIWVPKRMKFQTLNWRPPNPVHHFDPLDPKGLVRDLLKPYGEEGTPAFHTILFDAYSLLGEAPVKFWGPFHRYFIFALQQVPTHKRKRLILSIDELHDIVHPSQHSITREHQKTRAQIEQIYRKLRKYGTKVIASAHRPNQLPINIRSQFAYFIFKQTYPSDAWALLNQKLTHIPNRLFYVILSDVVNRLHVSEFYLFDDRGHFDKFNNVDLPRYAHLLTPKERAEQVKQFGYVVCGLKTEIAGSIDDLFSPPTDETGLQFTWKALVVFFRRMHKRGTTNWASYVQLGEELGIGKSTVQDYMNKMRKVGYLDDMLAEPV